MRIFVRMLLLAMLACLIVAAVVSEFAWEAVQATAGAAWPTLSIDLGDEAIQWSVSDYNDRDAWVLGLALALLLALFLLPLPLLLLVVLPLMLALVLASIGLALPIVLVAALLTPLWLLLWLLWRALRPAPRPILTTRARA